MFQQRLHYWTARNLNRCGNSFYLALGECFHPSDEIKNSLTAVLDLVLL